jgi:hypothetical protein
VFCPGNAHASRGIFFTGDGNQLISPGGDTRERTRRTKSRSARHRAASSDGKPLKGAAKNSFMAKCAREQG